MANKELEEKRIEAQQEASGLKIGQQIASDLLDRQEKADDKVLDDYKKGLDIAKDLVNDSKLNE